MHNSGAGSTLISVDDRRCALTYGVFVRDRPGVGLIHTIDLGSVIDIFKGAGTRMNILVLDACRDNPFASSTSSAKRLAQLDAPPGTFLAYATAPGKVAEDGDEKSGNGMYTQYLLLELRKPFGKIEDVFKRVRLSVRQKTKGRQIPWDRPVWRRTSLSTTAPDWRQSPRNSFIGPIPAA